MYDFLILLYIYYQYDNAAIDILKFMLNKKKKERKDFIAFIKAILKNSNFGFNYIYFTVFITILLLNCINKYYININF